MEFLFNIKHCTVLVTHSRVNFVLDTLVLTEISQCSVVIKKKIIKSDRFYRFQLNSVPEIFDKKYSICMQF